MKPFKNLKVIELANVLAGPAVGQFFAELGAEVIKIENVNTQGDVTRKWKTPNEKSDYDISAYFSSVNWGKKSIALNFRKTEAIEIVNRLVSLSDIIIASYKPGDAKQLSVDYESLKKINEKIIYAEVTGYGNDESRVGYDAIIQAECGFTYLNGELNGDPIKMPVALMDVLAAHQLKEAILIALIERMRTNKGSKIEVSLIQTGIASLANQSANWLVGGFIPERIGSDHPNIVPYGTIFNTADNKMIVLAVGTDKQFQGLCDVLEISETGVHSNYSTNTLRIKNKDELNKILKDRISKIQKATLLEKLKKQNIPAGSINDMKEVFDMNVAKEILLSATSKEQINFTGVRTNVFKINNDLPDAVLSIPPHYAQHTEEIIIETLGFALHEIETLEKNNVIEVFKS
ncbi:MAG: CoA transferase [Ignavibacteriales bacterium]|nr:MAG: CoA transferase [Ignavibacteriales bacterium]